MAAAQPSQQLGLAGATKSLIGRVAPGRLQAGSTGQTVMSGLTSSRTTFLLPPDRPGKTETCRRRNPQRPTGRSDFPVPAPASASPKPTPSWFDTRGGLPALPRPRSGPCPKSIPRAGTSASPPERDPAAPHVPEAPRPVSWRAYSTPRSTGGPYPPVSRPAWENRCRRTPTPAESQPTWSPSIPGGVL